MPKSQQQLTSGISTTLRLRKRGEWAVDLRSTCRSAVVGALRSCTPVPTLPGITHGQQRCTRLGNLAHSARKARAVDLLAGDMDSHRHLKAFARLFGRVLVPPSTRIIFSGHANSTGTPSGAAEPRANQLMPSKRRHSSPPDTPRQYCKPARVQK